MTDVTSNIRDAKAESRKLAALPTGTKDAALAAMAEALDTFARIDSVIELAVEDQVLVERLSGMKFLDYLKVKLLNRLGDFENAEILATPDGTPWGDSALLCTPRALLKFARFRVLG